MSKREEEKAIEATKVAEEARGVEDKRDAAQTLQEIQGQVTAKEIQ
jgi:hypothetical protein